MIFNLDAEQGRMMNYDAVEQTLKAAYRDASSRYRRDDEIEVATENHQRLSARLKSVCESFPHPIDVLDIGCGTGRYFYCLTNVRQLTGVDITAEMLEAARNPVRAEKVSARSIRLLRANVYFAEFPPESFHFIYSLGMFGNGCPVTARLCDTFYDWLTPGGRLFFDTLDTAGLPWWYRARRSARRRIYPLLPRRWQAALDEREARHPFCGMSRHELEDTLRRTRFKRFEIHSHECRSPLWSGWHLECLATKEV